LRGFKADLAIIYDPGVSDTRLFGKLTQDHITGRLIPSSLLSRTSPLSAPTGVGKDHGGDAVAAQALKARSSLRVAHSRSAQ